MCINEKKTQLLTISAKKDSDKAWIKTPTGDKITSGETLKLLGFVFGKSPTVKEQIVSFYKRTFLLRKFSQFMPGDELIKVYCLIIRSVLEYSSASY